MSQGDSWDGDGTKMLEGGEAHGGHEPPFLDASRCTLLQHIARSKVTPGRKAMHPVNVSLLSYTPPGASPLTTLLGQCAWRHITREGGNAPACHVFEPFHLYALRCSLLPLHCSVQVYGIATPGWQVSRPAACPSTPLLRRSSFLVLYNTKSISTVLLNSRLQYRP